MNQKTTYAILFAVIVAAVAVWWSRPSPQAALSDAPRPGQPRPVFDPAPTDITSVEIAPQGKPPIALAKEDAKWRITAPLKAPAAAGMVDSCVNTLRDMKYVEALRPGDADRPSDELTGLDKPVRVKLTDAAGKSYVVKIGAAVPAARQTYVQKDADDAIYVVDADLRATIDKSLNDFRDKRICDFATADAVRIEVAGEESYVLVKSDQKWTLESPARGRADAAAVDGLLRSVSNLWVQTFVDDAPANLAVYGLARPNLSITVHCEKKTPKPAPETQTTQPVEPQFDVTPYTVSLMFGAKIGDKRFGRLGGDDAPWVFQVMDSTVKNIAPELLKLRDKALTRVDVMRAQRVLLSGETGSAELTREAGSWQVRSDALRDIGSNAAEFAAVDDLLKAVRDLKATGFEVADQSLADYGFAQPRVTIEITAEGSVEPVRLLVGRDTPSGTGAYVRNDRENFVAVIKTEDLQPLRVGPLNFVNRDMLRFDRSRVAKLEVLRDGLRATIESLDNRWTLTDPIRDEAESPAVNNVLTDLSTLRARRVVATAAQLAEYGLDRAPITARITVNPPPPPPKPAPTTQPATQPGQEAVAEATTQPETPPPPPPDVYVLRAARRDGTAYIHVEGTHTICEVDGRVFENLDAELLKHDVTPAEFSTVSGVRVAHRDGPEFAFTRPADQWTLEGEPTFACDSFKVEGLIRAFCDLKTTRYLAYNASDLAPWGLNDPALRITYRTTDGVEQELRIAAGGPPDDASGRRHATIVGSGRVFLMATEDFNKFNLQIKDFQKAS